MYSGGCSAVTRGPGLVIGAELSSTSHEQRATSPPFSSLGRLAAARDLSAAAGRTHVRWLRVPLDARSSTATGTLHHFLHR